MLLATLSALLTSNVSLAQGFGRRLGLAEFATNDLLRHARASTSSDENGYPSIESRQLPNRQQAQSRQRVLRPILRQPSSSGRPISNRNRLNRVSGSEENASNFVQQYL